MFVNFGYVGGESVYRGLSGNIRKRTQENASPSGFFPGYIGYIRYCSAVYRVLSSFYRQPHTYERPPTDTRRLGGRSSLFRGGSGVFLHASALFRYVRVYIGSNSAGNRG